MNEAFMRGIADKLAWLAGDASRDENPFDLDGSTTEYNNAREWLKGFKSDEKRTHK